MVEYNNTSNEYYSQIFIKQFITGSKLGFVAAITSPYNPFKIISDPILNRGVGIGESNIVEEFYYPTLPTNYYNFYTTNALTENLIYRGIARVNKFIYNMWIANSLTNIYINSNSPKKLAFAPEIIPKLFIDIAARSGSEVIGAIEKKLPDPVTKFIYTGLVFSSIFTISSIFSPDISFKNARGTFLSQQDIAKTAVGFVASYLVLDAYLLSEIREETVIFSKIAEESSIQIINEFQVGVLDTFISLINTVTVFALSKGIGVTLVAVADDNIGLSEFISDSIQSSVTLIAETYKTMSLDHCLSGLILTDDFDII